MKILMTSTPSTGHISPLLAIGRMLMAEGHELVCLSNLLPAVALAVTLSPLATHARRNPQPGPARYYLTPLHHQDAQKHSHIDK